MQNILIFITALLLLFFNSYYSTYGIILLLLFSFANSFISNKSQSKLSILTTLVLILSYIFSGIKSQSLEPTLLMIVMVNNLNSLRINKNTLKTLIKILTSTMFVLSLIQIFNDQFAFGPFINIFNKKEIYPNAFAALNLLLIPLNSRNFQVMNILNILLSKSRIAIIISMGYFLWKHIRKTKNIKRAIAICVCLAVIPFTLITKSNQSLDFNSIDQRLEHWQNTPRLLNKTKEIFLGYGANSFAYIYPQVQKVPENQSPHSHNLILNIAVEYGIIFLFLLSLLLYKKFKYLEPEYKSALLLFLVHNLLDLNIQFPLTILILLLIINAQNHSKQQFNIQNSILSLTGLLILIISLTNNFIIGHKDEYLQSKNMLQTYIRQNPLDKKQLLKIDEKKYIKQVFRSNPYSVDNLEILLKHYPDIKLNKVWLDNYKKWYVSHSKFNLNYIHEKGTVKKLQDIFKSTDPTFVQNLEL